MIVGSLLAMGYSGEQGLSLRQSLKQVAQLPPLWALAAALGCKFLHIPVPGFILHAVGVLGSAVSGLMILSLGMALKFRRVEHPVPILAVCAIKLLLAPVIAVAAAFTAFATVPWGAETTLFGLLDEPVKLELFVSRADVKLGAYRESYARRVETLLRQYAAASGGKLRLVVTDPKPDTKEEQRAQRQNLGAMNTPAGAAYLGLTAQQADTVLLHGKIVTADAAGSIRQALAVRGGRLVALGTDADVRRLVGAGTRVVDLQGRTVIPGLIDSHLHATRAAVEEGIVPGGGVALLRASEQLKGLKTKNDDQKTGVEIVRKAIQAPARQIALNAGEDGSIIVGKILEHDTYSYGFDAQSGEYVDMLKKGIIDPAKVVRSALQNAASIAGAASPS